MKVKIEDHTIRLDVTELVDAMSPEDKRTVARALCADEQLIKAVLDIVADDSLVGYGHYFEDEPTGPWWFDSRTTLEIREKLIPILPEAARLMVRQALRQRDEARADERRHSDWAWKLYHAWPDGHWQSRPRLPDWKPLPFEPEQEPAPSAQLQEGE